MTRTSKNILIVDDSPTTLARASIQLLDAGYKVETTDTLWISELVNRLRPALVLMDVNLGVSLKGTEAIKALKERRYARHTKFVLYSSLSESELSRLTQECEADGFVCKENPEDLLPEVRRLLGESPPTPAERPETSENERMRMVHQI